MRLFLVLIGCAFVTMFFPFVTDCFFTGHEREVHPVVPALIDFGGPFVLALVATAFAQPLSSWQARARLVLLCGVAFGIGYTVSMNHVRRDGPGNLAPIEMVLMTMLATGSLGAGAIVGSLVSMARQR